LRRNKQKAKKMDCPDHFNVQKRVEKALKLGLPVVLTEKNAVRLPEWLLGNKRVFVCGVGVINY
jgi:tetraacyldisaccharide 4'-kinase